MRNRLKVGDRVRLVKGRTEMEIVQVSHQRDALTAVYRPLQVDQFHDGDFNPVDGKTYPIDRFMAWDDPPGGQTRFEPKPETKNGEDTMNTLYTWTLNDVVSYGTKLATNSAGDLVMEVKGTKELAVVPAVAVEKVLPYSVGVTFGSNDAKTYDYWATKGTLTAGQAVMLEDGSVVFVRELDTKSTKANKWLVGFALQGTPLTAG